MGPAGVLFLNRQRRRTISALLASRPGVEWRLRIRLSRVFTDSMRSQIEYSGNSFSKLQRSLRRGLEWSGDYGLDYLEYLRTVCEARLSIRAIRFRNFSSAWFSDLSVDAGLH